MISTTVKTLIDLCLGDGYFSKQHTNARLKIDHSEKQREYLWHKAQKLESLGITGKETIYHRTLAGKTHIVYSYQTHVHPDITTAHKWLYNKGRKAIDKALLKQLDVVSLAYFFMDDGTANRTNKSSSKHPIYGRSIYTYPVQKINSYTLQTNCFTYDEVRLLQDWMLSMFNIHTLIQFARGLPELRISGIDEKNKFRDLIKPLVLPLFYYKFDGVHQFKGVQYTSVQRERLSGKTPELQDDATV